MTKKALEATETYAEDVKKNFHATLDWLHEHACSRSYGLGEYYMGVWEKTCLRGSDKVIFKPACSATETS